MPASSLIDSPLNSSAQIMQDSTDKIIGVLGGLGPEATLDFCARILRNTDAKSDQDHIRCIIDNNPKAVNRNQAIAGTGPSPAPQFSQSAKILEQSGVDFIVMPCNTAHAFDSAITDVISIPFVSIIEETRAYIQSHYPATETVGLLAADGCLQAGLYQPKLASMGIEVCVLDPKAQQQFMQVVYRIKQDGADDKIRSEMIGYARQLSDQGAEIIMAGCTEVPLVLNQDDLTLPLIDTTEILAQQAVRYAKGTLKISSNILI